MSIIKKLFGDIDTGDLAYFRDSRHASFNFGLTNNYMELNYPRHKFLYFVRIDFNPELAEFTSRYFKKHDIALLIPLVKNVIQPSVSVTTEEMNQYNKKRITQKKLSHKPVDLTFHDVADGKTLRLWEMYYEYYYRNGVNPNKIDPTTKSIIKEKFVRDTVSNAFTSGDSGYNLSQVGTTKQLFDSVSIYQVHGGHYSKAVLVNPIISDFSPGNLAYNEDATLCEHKMSFQYEDIVYYNYIEALEDTDAEIFSHGKFKDLAPTKPRIPVRVENRVMTGAVTALNQDGSLGDDSFLGKISSAIGTGGKLLISDLLNVGTNTQRGLSNLVKALPGIAASGVKQGLLTGEFKFPVNLKSAINNIRDQGRRQTIGAGVRAFGAVVEGVTGAVGDVVSDIFLDDDRKKDITLEEYVAMQGEDDAFESGDWKGQ
jgi:hypothetical protein